MANSLIPLVIDWETYYSKEYTLSKLMTSQYVLDERMEEIGVGLGLGGALPVWFSGDRSYIHRVLSKIPWDRTLAIAHNAIFDAAILEWIYGYKPAKWFCTMMASRPFVVPYTGRMSLSAVAKWFDFGVKGNAVLSALGKHRADFSSQELREYGEYCCNDVVLTSRIWEKLSGILPSDEQDLLDLTIKKFVRPKLKLNANALETRLCNIQAEKDVIVVDLAKKGMTPEALRSRTQFAAALELQGVKVPKKLSKTAKDEHGHAKETFAFSKQDAEFMELLITGNDTVREFVQARLKLMSTMEETRLARLIDVAALNVGGNCLLPVPLLYYGAHPGRFSGLDKINLQNLPRIKFLADGKTQDPESGWLRRSIIAPDGHVIIAADLSNIEARIVAALAGQHDMVNDFRLRRDLYALFASRIYGRLIDKKNNPEERFVGKTCILGLGYGMGWAKFLMQMILARAKGVSSPEDAKRIVYLYRDVYDKIPMLWAQLESYLRKCTDPAALFTFGPLTFMHERIVLPNGMPLIYPGLKISGDQLEFVSKRAVEEGASNKLWGGAITENVVQALARIIIARAELRLAKLGLQSVLQVHDELVYCVPEKHAEAVKKAVALSMRASVDFLPNLPIDCEVGIGPSYAEAK
jgi:DNA polymerase I-like protein with 3'-5' exonuclease and polymerase domains